MDPERDECFAEPVKWSPAAPRFEPLRLALALLVGAVAVWVAALLLPGVHVQSFAAAMLAASLVGVLNAILPPAVAALRLPLTLVLRFLAVLAVDAAILLLVSDIASPDIKVDSFGWALLAAWMIAAASMAFQTILGVNDEDTYSLRLIERVARRQGEQARTDVAGIVFLEVDGLAAPVLRRVMRDGNVPVLARWLEPTIIAVAAKWGTSSAAPSPRCNDSPATKPLADGLDRVLGAGRPGGRVLWAAPTAQ